MTGKSETISERVSRLRTREMFRQANNIDTLAEYSTRRGSLQAKRRRKCRKKRIL